MTDQTVVSKTEPIGKPGRAEIKITSYGSEITMLIELAIENLEIAKGVKNVGIDSNGYICRELTDELTIIMQGFGSISTVFQSETSARKEPAND